MSQQRSAANLTIPELELQRQELQSNWVSEMLAKGTSVGDTGKALLIQFTRRDLELLYSIVRQQRKGSTTPSRKTSTVERRSSLAVQPTLPLPHEPQAIKDRLNLAWAHGESLPEHGYYSSEERLSSAAVPPMPPLPAIPNPLTLNNECKAITTESNCVSPNCKWDTKTNTCGIDPGLYFTLLAQQHPAHTTTPAKMCA